MIVVCFFFNILFVHKFSSPTIQLGYDNDYAAYIGRVGDSMPVTEPGLLYYSFDYRNVHFISLDSDGLEMGDEVQEAWLKEDLQVCEKDIIYRYSTNSPPI